VILSAFAAGEFVPGGVLCMAPRRGMTCRETSLDIRKEWPGGERWARAPV